LEHSLGTCRPDIYIEGYKKEIAIEVQTSSLTPYQILDRTQRYHAKGIYVLWVIPFERDRVCKYDNNDKCYYYTSIRLKEYERIMMYLYFKDLILWDVNRNYEKGFVVLKLGDS